MAITVEQFGKNLIKILSEHPGSRGGYVLNTNMIAAIQRALLPANKQIEYPKMLYKGNYGGEQAMW